MAVVTQTHTGNSKPSKASIPNIGRANGTPKSKGATGSVQIGFPKHALEDSLKKYPRQSKKKRGQTVASC